MSGGHFEYNQYRISDIADQIDRIIKNNNKKDDFGFSYNYNNETLKKFKETSDLLKQGYKMVHRIDWIVSGDDGEEDFHKRWKEDGLK